jgi:hypothetical protein
MAAKGVAGQRDKSLHPRPDVAPEDREIRQAPLQKAQSHRDHVRSPKGLETCRHTLRQVPEDLPFRNRIGRNRSVLAVIKNESGL